MPQNGTGCTEVGVCGKDPDIQSLQDILLYGVIGMAAYAHHARRLGKAAEAVSAFIEEALFATVTNVNFDMDSLFEMVLECGQYVRVMELLDAGHTERFGKPTPTAVYEGTKAGPGILVTATTCSICRICWSKRRNAPRAWTRGNSNLGRRCCGRSPTWRNGPVLGCRMKYMN